MFDYTNFEPHQNIQKSTYIHSSALVSKGAEFDHDVVVGPGAIIGPTVKLGKGVKVGAGAIVSGNTQIGEGTIVYPKATVGSDPQDLKFDNENTSLVIGRNNRIREYVNISLGTVGGGGETSIGDDNLIMVYTHIGHDCHIGSNCIFANAVSLAGHVVVGDSVVFGGMAGAHQFCRFGNKAMIAAGAIVVQDVPPYCLVQGDRARINGLNVVGIRRSGMNKDQVSDVKNMFKILYNENLRVVDAINKIEQELEDSQNKRDFLDFLRNSERGVCR